MRALLMPAVVAAVQITSPSHHDADQMRESFYSLAAVKDKNGGKLDDATKLEVQRILDLVENNLIAALWTDRDEAQGAYNTARDRVNGCNSQLVDTDLPLYVSEKTTTGREHAGFNECLDEENLLCAYKEGNCTALDNYVCGWSSEVCADGPIDDEECSDCKTIDPTTTPLYNAAKCLVGFHDKYFDTYIRMNDKCDALKRELTRKISDCDDLQEDLETQKCLEQSKINGFCLAHDTCWTSTTGSLADTKTTTQNLENIFQKQYTALQCLLCYGDQILADQTDLSACENSAPPTFACTPGSDAARVTEPTVSLAICYYKPEDKYNCEGEKDKNIPCTAGYDAAYYAAYNETCAKVDECKKPCE